MSTSSGGAPSRREQWETRPAFLLAAIGAAVGFGNVWRFPSLVYKYNGAIFFVPYVLALLVVGIPLLIYELSMGQHLQKSDVGVQNYLNKHTKGVGVGSIVAGLLVVTYYVPLISWCIKGFIESFFDANVEDYDGYNQEWSQNRVPTRIEFTNVVYLGLTWILVGCCLAFGLKWTGRIAYVTMGLPVAMLLVFLIRALTLDNASEGVHQYFGVWDWSVLFNKPDVWSTAVAQIFFSIGVAFGIMTAFGSHCDKHAPAVENAFVIAVANSTFSILSGLSLFAVMGYMSSINGNFHVPAGPNLLFTVYPEALSTLPGGMHWVRLLFFFFILLGLDSAFALVEAVASLVTDSSYGHMISKTHTVAAICGIGFCGGLLYTTDTGWLFLDTIDFYVNFAVLFLGFCKALSAGWIYGMSKQVQNLGNRWNIVYAYYLTTFGSFLFASLVWFGVKGDTFWLGFLSLLLIYGCGVAYCLNDLQSLCEQDPSMSMKFLRNELLMGNILELRQELSSSVGYLPWIWAFLMKHAVPQILLVLFFNLFFAKTEYETIAFGNYNGYLTWPYQVVGVLSALLVFGTVFAGALDSKLFSFLIANDGDADNDWVDVEMKDAAAKGQPQSNTEYSNMDNMDEETVLESPKEAVAAAATESGGVLA